MVHHLKVPVAFAGTWVQFPEPYGGSQPFVTQGSRDTKPSSDLLGHQSRMWYTYINAEKNTPTHKLKDKTPYMLCPEQGWWPRANGRGQS